MFHHRYLRGTFAQGVFVSTKSTLKCKRQQQAQNKTSRYKTKQVGLTPLAACMTCQPVCLVSLTSLPACMTCQPVCLVSLTTWLCAFLFCFVPTTIACSSKWIFAVATNSAIKAKQGRRYMSLISLFKSKLYVCFIQLIARLTQEISG